MSVFADEFIEAGETTPAPTSRTPPRPTTSTPPRAATSPRPGAPPPRPTATTRPPQPAPRPAPAPGRTAGPARPHGGRPAPAGQPAPRRPSTAQDFLSYFQRAAPLLQQGWDFARMGMQIGQQFSARPGAPPPGPPSAPDMPGAAPPMPTEPPAPTGPPQSDPLSLLRMIVSNPQVIQALQPPTPASPRSISLPMPAPGQPDGRQISLPLGAVMNAIYALAGQSMDRLNANTREDDPEVPEYLISEDGEFLVDPADSDARAELVSRLFEISESARPPSASPRRRGRMPYEGE